MEFEDLVFAADVARSDDRMEHAADLTGQVLGVRADPVDRDELGDLRVLLLIDDFEKVGLERTARLGRGNRNEPVEPILQVLR